jgi:hypothetical protein
LVSFLKGGLTFASASHPSKTRRHLASSGYWLFGRCRGGDDHLDMLDPRRSQFASVFG